MHGQLNVCTVHGAVVGTAQNRLLRHYMSVRHSPRNIEILIQAIPSTNTQTTYRASRHKSSEGSANYTCGTRGAGSGGTYLPPRHAQLHSLPCTLPLTPLCVCQTRRPRRWSSDDLFKPSYPNPPSNSRPDCCRPPPTNFI